MVLEPASGQGGTVVVTVWPSRGILHPWRDIDRLLDADVQLRRSLPVSWLRPAEFSNNIDLLRAPGLVWDDSLRRRRQGPHFGHQAGSMEVAFYDSSFHDARRYPDPVDACGDFLCREAAWVLTREQTC